MQLPIRGCLITAAGRVVSAWEWNNPGTPEMPVLIIENPDGDRTTGFAPDDLILDLTAVTQPGDMITLYKEQHELRAFKDTAGKWQFKKVRDGIDLPSEFGAITTARRTPQEVVLEPPIEPVE